jgi:hypothetical protein
MYVIYMYVHTYRGFHMSAADNISALKGGRNSIMVKMNVDDVHNLRQVYYKYLYQYYCVG